MGRHRVQGSSEVGLGGFVRVWSLGFRVCHWVQGSQRPQYPFNPGMDLRSSSGIPL